MNQCSQRLLVIQKIIALSVLYSLSHVAYASSEQDEIILLRNEVSELRSLIQKNSQYQDVGKPAPETIKSKVASDVLGFKTKTGAQFELYGVIRAYTSYQFEGGDGMFNRINEVGLGDSSIKNKLDTTLTTTRIGMNFTDQIQEDQKVTAKLEMDFRGGTNNDSLRIRHAYLTFNNWLLGQTTSSFLALDFQPDMVDFGGPLGAGATRTPMVRYSNNFKSTDYFVGLEKASSDSRLPALTAKATSNFLRNKMKASVRGLLTEVRSKEAYTNIVDSSGQVIDSVQSSQNDSKLGWGVALGMKYQITDDLFVLGDYSHVKGDSKFLFYTNSAFNISPSSLQINLNEFDAFTIGATYKFTPKLSSTLAYGAMFANDHNEFAKQAWSDSAQNKSLQQGWLNMMYSPIKPVAFGLEYLYGERKTFDGQLGKDNRIVGMVRYSF